MHGVVLLYFPSDPAQISMFSYDLRLPQVFFSFNILVSFFSSELYSYVEFKLWPPKMQFILMFSLKVFPILKSLLKKVLPQNPRPHKTPYWHILPDYIHFPIFLEAIAHRDKTLSLVRGIYWYGECKNIIPFIPILGIHSSQAASFMPGNLKI